MKIAGLIFIGLVILIALKYTKVFPEITLPIIIGVSCLWLVIVYVQTHIKNRERNIPRPVFIQDQE